MKLSLAEIVNEAIKKKNNPEKVAWLKQNNSEPLRMVLQIMYDKNITVLLPNSEPPYKPSEVIDSEGMLFREARRLKLFVKGAGYDNLNQIKREQLFIGLLEDVDKKDARLLIQMILQKPLTGLPISVIKESFPGLITEIQTEKKED